MSAGAVTQWFDAQDKPVREGFYEVDRLELWPRRAGGMRVRRMVKWDGDCFRFVESDSIVRRGYPVAMFSNDKDMWRGLASDPFA